MNCRSKIRGENKDKGFIKPNLPIKILDNFKCSFLPLGQVKPIREIY